MIRLLLLDTSPAATNGSMSRYTGLVARALEVQPGLSALFTLQTIRLSLPGRTLSWLPGAARVWANHLWILLTSRYKIAHGKHDLVHLLDGSYSYVLNGIAESATTATVHDLIPQLQQKGHLGPARPSIPARWIADKSVRGLRQCRHLVADSGSTRRDLVRETGIDGNKISVVWVALDPNFTAATKRVPEKVSANSLASRPIVLHVGHNGSYKNREGVLRIFSKLRAHCEARLVMAGSPPTFALRELVKSLQLVDDVLFIENPDDAELVRLYQGASVFLFPSIYEGFGWPPLEAMACGCPVVCSTAASLPEVVGDAALTAAADDEAGLARLCGQVLSDGVLALSLIAKGKQRASEFTLERMGAQLLAVYFGLLEQSPKLGGEKTSQ